MSEADPIKAKFTIKNRLGFHARPAMSFVERASKFKSKITISNDRESVDGKSIMQLMMLAATQGTELDIEAMGPDAEDAVNDLVAFADRKFDQKDPEEQ
ncbi:MAG: HPr family phosphocarrier protein [Phycisphaera sp.]|nr:HPr family phosphocarrier protein [Phycisphaera sp.]